ncbi:hypothetical protein [Catellatospora chokoriensis]|uniref:Hsp20/alpha crystallin family protein n=1 Tax=Catellatospora chokoriensis TaxID=310353 RepID=A0A8J3KF18_9ACTN|nr:hypothetical protein [Catellatospora chokoriensis]GIF94699.1 hypothetical protein Cch02nite_81430 [Catellatospora chokoriensis]
MRTELLELNPDTDMQVSADSGVLDIHAERRVQHKIADRSEFH